MPRKKYEGHHLLHHGNLWEGNADNHHLRQKSGLIIPMDFYIHDELHANCPGVPPLDIFTARRVKSIMAKRIGHDVLRNVDVFMSAVSEAVTHPKSHPIERQLGELVVMAVEVQKPYLIEGFIDGTT